MEEASRDKWSQQVLRGQSDLKKIVLCLLYSKYMCYCQLSIGGCKMVP